MITLIYNNKDYKFINLVEVRKFINKQKEILYYDKRSKDAINNIRI